MAIKNPSLFSVILGVIPILLLHSAQSLDIKSAKELACFKPPTTAITDLQWMMSVKKWYYVMGSRLDLYEFASEVANKDPEELLEVELYYKSCLTWEAATDTTFVATGFGGLQKTYKVNPLDSHFGAVEFSAVDAGGLSGTSYTTLTDNKTYTFAVTCYPDSNDMVWTVASPYKSLPKETMKMLHEQAESYGFKRKHFTGLRYDSCDNDEEEASQGKNEL